MSTLVWDSTNGAWKEAETPMVYDAIGGWNDSVGKVWDSTEGAWKDAWSGKKLPIFDTSAWEFYNNKGRISVTNDLVVLSNSYDNMYSAGGQTRYFAMRYKNPISAGTKLHVKGSYQQVNSSPRIYLENFGTSTDSYGWSPRRDDVTVMFNSPLEGDIDHIITFTSDGYFGFFASFAASGTITININSIIAE